MAMTQTAAFTTIYGPVNSWRYGRSLGVDPIGEISTCSFNCVYCQLGEIEQKTSERQVYIATQHILQELENYAPWDVDVITLSGSGEPTLALNLAEILQGIKRLTGKPILVLTNGTLLGDAQVRQDLSFADKVSVKLDAVSAEQMRRVDRPMPGLNFSEILAGIEKFRAEFSGEIGIQTMILSPWSAAEKAAYIQLMNTLTPAEIQLNTPTRPKPLKRQLDGRGNHSKTDPRPYDVQHLKCVSLEVLRQFAEEIHHATHVPVKFAPTDF